MENILNIHNAQMEKIIQMVSEIKEGSKNKGKQEKRDITVYTSDNNEFY